RAVADLATLFAQDPNRVKNFNIENNTLYCDFSKNHLTLSIRNKLVALAEQQDLRHAISSLSSTDSLSNHVLLRDPSNSAYHKTLADINMWCANFNARKVHGVTGTAITDIVHLGVGGSFLGPFMVNSACTGQNELPYKLHYAYAMDGNDLLKILPRLNPSTSLFIVASKSFSTIDTLANADLALEWLTNNLPYSKEQILGHHFLGISASSNNMTKWGITADKQLLISNNTVGRYSIYSSMGLPIALHLGIAGFKQLLAGANSIDKHFIDADLAYNIPVMLGLLAVWNHNFMGFTNHTYLPYSSHLEYLPHYLQQMMMESLGKSYTKHNREADYLTGAVVFGEVGFAAQHSFFQLLHQGTGRVACDFIAVSQSDINNCDDMLQSQIDKQHQLTLANCFAQSRVLMLGSNTAESDANDVQQHIAGNNPSTTILLDKLNPFNLGSLIAVYEHKTFVESVIYNINPFSQDGVELGKKIARNLFKNSNLEDLDASSAALINRCNAKQAQSNLK
ncbi:glucose-6-phosphate isomerase, partial [Gammaproteobacteria bacterium]|nr:glucose-6-phosphate isomerase [Gammaproteobacteria bacterium]